MRYLFLIASFILTNACGFSQQESFIYEKTPLNSGFRMDGYWVWGGSMIKAGSKYQLFASRWKKDGPFPEGYRQNSEIVRASSDSPFGPYKFEEVVIGERDSSFWDSNMSHNPTIHKIGNEYVLFYIGSDFTTLNASGNLLRRVGYATAMSINGPWIRSDKPVVNSESNNPAILVEKDCVKLVYRDSDLKVYLAESDTYKGPFKVLNNNLWPKCKLEDFYIFKAANKYNIVCEDNVGEVSGHVRWGVRLFSDDGINNWQPYDPVVVYDHEIILEDNSVLKCIRRERPQFLIENGMITYLINGVYDGNESWCQPVKLKFPLKTDQNY